MDVVVAVVRFAGSDLLVGQVQQDVVAWLSLLESEVRSWSLWESDGGVYVAVCLRTRYVGLSLAGCGPSWILQSGFFRMKSWRWVVEVEVVLGYIATVRDGFVQLRYMEAGIQRGRLDCEELEVHDVDWNVWLGSGLGLLDVWFFVQDMYPVGYKVETQVGCFRRGVMAFFGNRSRYNVGNGECLYREEVFSI